MPGEALGAFEEPLSFGLEPSPERRFLHEGISTRYNIG
jgi:hypothetical protein